MKQLIFTIILVLGFAIFISSVNAVEPDDLVIDTECVAYITNSGLRGSSFPCNEVCERQCIDAGKNCQYENPSECATILFDANFPEVTRVVKPAYNIFSLELCPDRNTRPDDDPYCTLTLVRLSFYAVISLIMFTTVLMGLWVAWVRSTAMDSPDKVEKAVSIARNAIIGVFITFLFLGIVQITSFVLGLTGSLFDFSVVPKPKTFKIGDQCNNIYGICPAGTTCTKSGANKSYCIPIH